MPTLVDNRSSFPEIPNIIPHKANAENITVANDDMQKRIQETIAPMLANLKNDILKNNSNPAVLPNMNWQPTSLPGLNQVKEEHPAIDLHAFRVLYCQVENCQCRIRSYLDKIDERGSKIRDLENFKQAIRAEGNNGVDWTNKPELHHHINKARAHGMIIPDGKLQWTKEETDGLVLNAESTIDPLLSSNDKDKVMLGWFQNKESEYLSVVSRMIKQAHDDRMEVIRQMGK